MKPFTHAQIAARRYGGDAAHWLPYHDWWDRSKAAFPSMQHRMFLHSELGIHWFVEKHGETIAVPGCAARTRSIAEDHMAEDVGFVPTVETWLQTLPAVPKGRPARPLREIRADRDAGAVARWGGTPADFDAIFAFFDSPLLFTDDERALALSHNSFALFILEELVGPVVTIGGRAVATRTIGEDLVLARYGHIPFPSALSRFHLAPWMRGARVADALRGREG